MPWHVAQSGSCPTSKPWAVIKDSDGTISGCHPSKDAATKQLAALYANAADEEQPMTETAQEPRDFSPPRDNLVRAQPGDFSVRDDSTGPVMTGHFAVFNDWTEIDSAFEGHFMERIAPGAFRKTLSERTPKVTFNHGKDPQLGDKVLGIPSTLEPDSVGMRYEVPIFEGVPPLIVSGLKAGAYGSSFRFSVIQQDKNPAPTRSAHNPAGIPERTVTEARLYEFGPVTYPQYAGATAGLRSMTDRYFLERLLNEPERFTKLVASMTETDYRSIDDLAKYLLADPAALAAAIDKLANGEPLLSQEADLLEAAIDHLEPPEDTGEMENALPKVGAEREAHSDNEEPQPPVEPEPPPPDAAPSGDPPDGGSHDTVIQENSVSDTTINPGDRPAILKELKSQAERFVLDHTGVLSAEENAVWSELTTTIRQMEADHDADEARRAFILDHGIGVEKAREEEVPVPSKTSRTYSPPNVSTRKVQDIYDFAEIRKASDGDASERQLIRDSAMRAIGEARFSAMRELGSTREVGQARVEQLLNETEDEVGYVARRILLTGNPVYRRALHRTLMGQTLSPEETQAYSNFQQFERAMGQATGSAGGFGVTFDLDPTMVQTSNGAIVPYRRASRVATITTNEWRGVTSGGVVASYAAEAAVGTDNSPTLAQPAAIVQKAHCFVPFSMEIQGDYAGLEAELGREIQDAKDVLEATQFTTGAGTTVFPQGIVTGATTAFNLATTGVLAAADLYNAEMTLAPRFRVGATWFANRMFYNKIRAIDTAGGAQLWTPNLRVGIPNDLGSNGSGGNTGYELLGYPANECSGFTTTFTGASNKVAVFGDPSYYVIVDRVGLNLELVPILTQQATAGTGFGIPTGQRGVYAWWRNTAKVLNAVAFLTITTI